jgi:acylphosphatase
MARRFDVTGFVRNLPSGKVELVVEGEEEVVKEFVQAVTEAMKPYIRGTEFHWSEAEGKFKGFGIAF